MDEDPIYLVNPSYEESGARGVAQDQETENCDEELKTKRLSKSSLTKIDVICGIMGIDRHGRAVSIRISR